MKKNSGNSQKRYLISALASLVAVSAMVTSVMSGCGSVEDTNATEVVHETQVVTKVVENTETKVITIDDDNSKDDNKSSNSANSSNNSSASQSSNNSSDKTSSAANGNSSSASNNSSSSKNSSSNSNSNSNTSSNAKPASSNTSSSNSSKILTVDGKKFNVGDNITCTYKLKSPDVLENFQASVKYDSKYLKVNKAALVGDAKVGSLVNYKITDKININGSNISEGYDYKNASAFLTVNYTVVSAGNTKTGFDWVAACQFGANPVKNYVSDNGTPNSGLKISKTYTKD